MATDQQEWGGLMKRREKNVKQHYIPQFHLRKFTDENEELYAYDIYRERQYKTAVRKENYKKYFYDVRPDLLKKLLGINNGYDELIDDKIRTLHEEQVARAFNQLVTLLNQSPLQGIKIEKEVRDKIHQYIVLQRIRTPEFRRRIKYMSGNFVINYGIDLEVDKLNEGELLDNIHNLLIYGLLLQFNNESAELPDGYNQFFEHFIEESMRFYKQLQNAGILVLLNRYKTPFYISDNPVNVKWHPNSSAYIKGLITPMGGGKTIDVGQSNDLKTAFVPISRNIGIFFFDLEFQEALTSMNNSIGVITEQNFDIIHNINLSTAANAYGKVYGSINDFSELIKMIKNKQPAIINFRF
jgi:hypothetical protein